MQFIPLLRRVLIAVVGFGCSSLSFAQTASVGTIEGRVLNATTGNYLDKARVVLVGTRLETLTNLNGEYRLGNVPAGLAEVVVLYSGFESQTKRVHVAAGGTTVQDYGLSLSSIRDEKNVVQMDAFKVTERELSAQAAALNDQKNAPNIKNVVTFDEFGDMGEGNPAEFLKFVPGITVGYGPEGASTVTVRGMPTNGTVVMIDGAPAVSASGDRQFNFQKTPTGNIASIEVMKVPTPDLPANAIGGSVNLIRKSGFSRSKPQLTYSAFGLFNDLRENPNVDSVFKRRAGSRFTARPLQPGFEVGYILPLNKTVAFTFNGGMNRRYYDIDTIQTFWNLKTLVNERYVKTDVINTFDRQHLTASMDLKVGRFGSLNVSGQYSTTQVQGSTAGIDIRFGANARGGPDFSESLPGVGVVAQGFNGTSAYYETTIGGLRYTHDGPTWKIDGNLGFTYAKADAVQTDDGYFRTVGTSLTGLTLRADGMGSVDTGLLPIIMATDAQGRAVDVFNGNNLTLSDVTGQPSNYTEVVKSLALNLARDVPAPFPLRLKVGVSAQQQSGDRTIDLSTWAFSPPGGTAARLASNYDLIATDMAADSQWRDARGKVPVTLISAAKMFDLYKSHPEYFVLNAPAYHSGHVNNSKAITETITAAYFRSDAKFFANRLNLVAGVRYEKTADEGEGPLNDVGAVYQRDAAGNIVRNAAGTPQFISADPLERARLQYKERAARSEKQYDGFHPSLNARYSITENLVARLGFARTIGRPAMAEIIPGVVFPNPSAQTGTPSITVINTSLKPWTADNLDLSTELYNVKGAVISVGVFRKDVSDFFATTTTTATPELLEEYGLGDEYLGYNIVRKMNRGNARISGLEWSWRQNLTFLPQWARGLQVYVNGTHMEISGPNAKEFTGFRSKSVNTGLTFSRAKFLFKANATLGTKVQGAPVAPSAVVPVGTSNYTAPNTTIDVSFEYRMTRRLSLYGSARNVTQNSLQSLIAAPETPDYATPRVTQRFGSLITLGVKGEF